MCLSNNFSNVTSHVQCSWHTGWTKLFAKVHPWVFQV